MAVAGRPYLSKPEKNTFIGQGREKGRDPRCWPGPGVSSWAEKRVGSGKFKISSGPTLVQKPLRSVGGGSKRCVAKFEGAKFRGRGDDIWPRWGIGVVFGRAG